MWGLDDRGAAAQALTTPMQRYAAFLRAINVGGHIVKMDRLRTLFVEMGFTDVATLIASGNVIFHSKPKSEHQLEGLIERRLREALGFEVSTFVRSTMEVASVARYEPFPRADLDTPGIALTVLFLRSSPSEQARKNVLSLRTATDEFHVAEREAYWLCRTRMSDSPVFKKNSFEKAIGIPGTSRNITTVRKMALLMDA